ncbi:MAG: Hsp20/alpha crystallin family protein [Nitrococcus sp.]|nr:Hsp20/alpha crystallin family protein [Nitrococcus sp.]
MDYKHGWRPFQGVTDFFSEMNRMSNVMHGRSAEAEPRTAASAWAPLTDILARNEDLVIRCELPGVEMKDIAISFSNGVLSISGNRETEAADSYYVRERFFGAFRRAISLPEGVGDDDIHASFKGGLLVITIEGGATAAQPKHIHIAGDGG